MRHDKKEATKLRSRGKSYREIKDDLGIPLATLSDWFRDERWSKAIKKSLNEKNIEISKRRIIHLDKIRGENLKKVYEEAREEAKEDFKALRYSPLFIAGIMIYWSEGDKISKNGFRVSNSDPLVMKIFLTFLRKVCGGDETRIRAGLLLYPDLDSETCEKYWSNQIGLSRSNFTKSIVIQGRHKTRRVQYGICTLNFSSRFLKEKMLIWMRLAAEDLLRE
ncbi:MAG: hypothetical protein NUV78_00345 [Candidatus Zambryskibacteria bacterium]|nr:hypothetical protein [Candidatus Zambryskibacteria bacterium]